MDKNSFYNDIYSKGLYGPIQKKKRKDFIMTRTRLYVRPTIRITGILSLDNAETCGGRSCDDLMIDERGEPRPDGGYIVHFRLYETPEGEVPFWSETHRIELWLGMFSVDLGVQHSLQAGWTGECWLGIQVGDESELGQRLP
jgi:hypothetical protein